MTSFFRFFVVVCTIFFFTSCSQNPSGTYIQDGHPEQQLTLTKDGTFLLPYGDSGTYSTEGKTIIMTNPMFGGAKGEIKGASIVFPKVSADDLVGSRVAGTWTRK